MVNSLTGYKFKNIFSDISGLNPTFLTSIEVGIIMEIKFAVCNLLHQYLELYY